MKNKILILAIIIVCALAFSQSALAQLRTLTPSQGGTGLGSATAGDVGNCLKVSDDSPFSYILGTCGGSVGGATSTNPFMATYFVATSSSATSTLHAITSSHVQAQSSAGFNLYSSSNSLIGTFGAGGGTNSTLNGGVNVLGLLTIPRLNSTSTAASYFNGNLGIGTTSPESLLDVDGIGTFGTENASTAQLVVKGGAAGGAMVTLKRTVGAPSQFSWLLSGGGLTFADDTNGFNVTNIFGDNSQNQLFIGQRGKIVSDSRVSLLSGTTFSPLAGSDVAASELRIQGGLGTGAGTPGDVSFYTGTTLGSGSTAQSGSSRMVIKGNTGFVGIGTSSPYSKLSVAGTIVGANLVSTSTSATSTFAGPVGIGGYFYAGPFLYDGTYSNFTGAYAPSYYIADFTKDADSYTSVNMTNPNSGSSASVDLTFNNGNTRDANGDGEFEYYADIGFNGKNYNVPSFGVMNVANGSYWYNKDGPVTIVAATSSSLGYINFGVGGFSSENVRITNTGALGVGSTSPTARLTVTNPLSTATALIEDQASDPTPFAIDASGNVGVGTSSPLAKLDVVDGNLRFSAVIAPSAAGPVGTAGAAGVLTGTYRYRTSFVTATGETVLSSLSTASVSVTAQQINVTGIATSTDKRVTARKLYRNKTADGVFAGYYLVATINDNTTTTYTDNTADGSLGALNSAIPTVGGVIYKNTAVLMNINETQTSAGYNSLRFSGGQANTAFGLGTMQSNTVGSFSNAFGNYALASQTTATANNAFGANALSLTTTGNSNSAFGNNAGSSNTIGTGNSFFGAGAGQNTQTGIDNAIFGAGAGAGVASNSFSNNSLFGRLAGTALSTGSNNLMLGYRVGDACVTCTRNILIGYDIDATSTSAVNFLNIGNTIFGTDINSTGTTVDTDAKIGIGTTTPATKLQVTNGASATTTVTVGELGLSTSKSCINMMTSAGTQASMYINSAGTLVTELNACK